MYILAFGSTSTIAASTLATFVPGQLLLPSTRSMFVRSLTWSAVPAFTNTSEHGGMQTVWTRRWTPSLTAGWRGLHNFMHVTWSLSMRSSLTPKSVVALCSCLKSNTKVLMRSVDLPPGHRRKSAVSSRVNFISACPNTRNGDTSTPMRWCPDHSDSSIVLHWLARGYPSERVLWPHPKWK